MYAIKNNRAPHCGSTYRSAASERAFLFGYERDGFVAGFFGFQGWMINGRWVTTRVWECRGFRTKNERWGYFEAMDWRCAEVETINFGCFEVSFNIVRFL